MEKRADLLLALRRALQDRALRTAPLCACVNRSSRSSLTFISKAAVSTETVGISKDLED